MRRSLVLQSYDAAHAVARGLRACGVSACQVDSTIVNYSDETLRSLGSRLAIDLDAVGRALDFFESEPESEIAQEVYQELRYGCGLELR